MFVLRTVGFLVVLYVFFRPICGEVHQNITELNITATRKVENDVTEKTNNLAPENIMVSEGGPLKMENKTSKLELTTQSVTIIKPISEKQPAEKVENKFVKIDNTTEANSTNTHRTVSKNGVSFNDTAIKAENVTVTTVKSTTVYIKPKKPTVTVGSDDESQIDQKSKNSSTEKVPTIEYYQQNKEKIKKVDFVIPIIAVILSVPVVAILINIFYKRGKEWWSHRHYRRMDFLIDGMYNN